MLERKLWHKSITEDSFYNAAMRRIETLDNPGICLICGNEQGGCEPDARNYTCESCGAEQVYGAEELILYFDF